MNLSHNHGRFARMVLALGSCVALLTSPTWCQTPPGAPDPCPEEKSAATLIARILDGAGRQAAEERFAALLADRERTYCIDEDQFNNLGYGLLYSGRAADAVAVFHMNVAAFPNSVNVYDSLGEGYVHLFNRERAAINYSRVLEMQPDNESARWSLETVGQSIADLRGETQERRRHNPGEPTGLKGSCFGQKPPGMRGVVFAPGIISTYRAFEFGPTFSPDGRELYFNRRSIGGGLMVCHWEPDGWTAPQLMPNLERGAFEPHITPDGARMFYGLGPEIWFRERATDGWGEPMRHGPGMFATTTRTGALYVTDISDPEDNQIVRQRWVAGAYAEPEKISETMKGPAFGAHPCIAPDESFLLFDSRPPDDPYADSDLYVCFRNDDGSWGAPILLGDEVNTDGENICMSLSPDGKYLFYTSRWDIYWVSVEILDTYRNR